VANRQNFFENQILFLSLTIIQQILFARNYSTESFISGKSRPTQRALDWWDSAAKMRGFNAWAFFGTISIVHAHPPASNAHRWLALDRYF